MSNKVGRTDQKRIVAFFVQTFYSPLNWVTWAMCKITNEKKKKKLIVPLALPVLEEVAAAVNGELLKEGKVLICCLFIQT